MGAGNPTASSAALPFHAQILSSLGQALRDVGRNMRAAEVWRSVSRLDPDHPSAHYRRAFCLKSINRTEEALAALRSVREGLLDDANERYRY